MASRSATSSRLVLCSLSHPWFRQPLKLLFITNQEYLLTRNHLRDEVLARAKLAAELSKGVNRGIDLAAEFALCRTDTPHDLHQSGLSDHHQIDVARISLGSGRHRAE